MTQSLGDGAYLDFNLPMAAGFWVEFYWEARLHFSGVGNGSTRVYDWLAHIERYPPRAQRCRCSTTPSAPV